MYKFMMMFSNIKGLSDFAGKLTVLAEEKPKMNLSERSVDKFQIYDERGLKVNTDQFETREQYIAETFILEEDIVLELGARYGSVSVKANKNLKIPTNQVVVEPDETVWDALEYNKKINGCEFHIVKGTISKDKMALNNDGYGTTSHIDETSKIPNYSLNEIKNKYNITHFTVLIADCEGFLEYFIDENPEILHECRLITYECDNSENCNYEKIKNKILENNFKCVVDGVHTVFIKNSYNFPTNSIGRSSFSFSMFS
jgi:FkbM family methyltransferase